MGAALGIDVGGTKLLACVIDADGIVLAEARVPTPSTRAAFVDALADLARDQCMALPAGVDLVGLGLGLPGLVDRAGVLHETPNIPAIEEMALHDELIPALVAACGRSPGSLPVVAENDATCAAAGEVAFGAARGATDAVVVTLGTGIGAGIIADGEVLLGGAGFAGEVGHMVVAADGDPCVCGRRGCWERYASGSAIARAARDMAAAGRAPRLSELACGDAAAVRAEEVAAAAAAGDPVALAIVADAAAYVAIGLGNLAEILDPQVIVVGGGLGQADVVVAPAIEAFAASRRGSGPRAVKVVRAALGEHAGAIGAGVLALGELATGSAGRRDRPRH